jgi:hypothetical protein
VPSFTVASGWSISSGAEPVHGGGAYSIKNAVTGTMTFGHTMKVGLGATSMTYFSCWVYFASLASDGTQRDYSLGRAIWGGAIRAGGGIRIAAAGNAVTATYHDSTGALTNVAGDLVAAGTITAGAWNKVIVGVEYVGVSPCPVKMWINGTLVVNATTAATTITQWAVPHNSSASTRTWYADDCCTWTGTGAPTDAPEIYARKIIAGTPTNNAWTKSTGSTIDTVWADIPFDATTNANTTVVAAEQTALGGTFATTESGRGTGTVTSADTVVGANGVVGVKTSSATSAGANTSAKIIRGGTASYQAYTDTTTTTWGKVSPVVFPTFSELNSGMEIGCRNDDSATSRTRTAYGAFTQVAVVKAATVISPPFQADHISRIIQARRVEMIGY